MSQDTASISASGAFTFPVNERTATDHPATASTDSNRATAAMPEPMPEPISLRARPLLYTETVNGQQVCRDDLWIVTTHLVNRAAAADLVTEQSTPVAARDLDVDAERREFEEACPGLNPLRYGKDHNYAYCSPVVEYHWQGWLARARRAPSNNSPVGGKDKA